MAEANLPSIIIGINEDTFITTRAMEISRADNRIETLQPVGPSQAEVAMWDDFTSGQDDTLFQMDPGMEETLENARQTFEHKLKNFGLWTGDETMSVEDDIGCVEDALNEAENDGILAEILKDIGKFRVFCHKPTL